MTHLQNTICHSSYLDISLGEWKFSNDRDFGLLTIDLNFGAQIVQLVVDLNTIVKELLLNKIYQIRIKYRTD